MRVVGHRFQDLEQLDCADEALGFVAARGRSPDHQVDASLPNPLAGRLGSQAGLDLAPGALSFQPGIAPAAGWFRQGESVASVDSLFGLEVWPATIPGKCIL